MKITSVLLRWYKSFNVNYMTYPDRAYSPEARPWNRLDAAQYGGDLFPFVEIPIENDITTIVGANESGKSHLLSAINKVLTGKDISGGRPFSRPDLCRYAPPSPNADIWPYLGLALEAGDSDKETTARMLGAEEEKATSLPSKLTLILRAENGSSVGAWVYWGDLEKKLTVEQLEEFRELMPRVSFLKSDLAMEDSIELTALLAAYRGASADVTRTNLSIKSLGDIATRVAGLAVPAANQALPASVHSELAKLQSLAADGKKRVRVSAQLEVLLFRDVLGIDEETLELIAELGEGDRGYVESLVTAWNSSIEEELNLSRYWEQDDSFALRVNYKGGKIYFEITDRTGAVYTFGERSSGLRYFLSYYIQAKALQKTAASGGAVIVMDEPDSFLSISGQRNLLSIFEALVSDIGGSESCQLIYTTHSPFLINRNFPRRVRLVRKGDAEEGTQYVDESRVRRYEPIRSALGVDCAQTLFMGTTNLVVEGPSDQFLLCELIRHYVTPSTASEFLDLNSIIVTSGESASGAQKLIAASQWGDEPEAAVVVLLDSDQAGKETAEVLTGKARRASRLLEDEQVLLVGELSIPKERKHPVVSIEDILSRKHYTEAVAQYLARWHAVVWEAAKDEIKVVLAEADYGSEGLVLATRKVFSRFVFNGADREYDKLGVLQEALLVLRNWKGERRDGEEQELRERLLHLCAALRERLSDAQRRSRQQSGKQRVQRLIRDFLKVRRSTASLFDLVNLLKRLSAEAEGLGVDGDALRSYSAQLQVEVEAMRSAGQQVATDVAWKSWRGKLEAIRRNPLEPIREVEVAEEHPGELATEEPAG